MLPLTTKRLIIRYLRPKDEEPLLRVFGDPEVMRFGDGVQSREWIHNWLQESLHQYEERDYGPYAVTQAESQELLGYCGLFYFPDVNGQPEIEIGYRFARVAWGKGYATEAAIAVKEYAFSSLGIQRLIAVIDPSNIASVRVAKKLGMKYEHDVMFEGYTHPDHVYAINYTE